MRALLVWAAVVPLAVLAGGADGAIPGLTGTSFTLTAKAGYISTPEGNSVYVWGYADGGGAMQYPGPTLLVNQGDTITIALTNQLSVPTSIVFPGQTGVAATGGSAGLLTRDAGPGQTVTYTFTAAEAGTYMYHSGTRTDLQIEMGLVGALIVRPKVGGQVKLKQAYGHADTAFDREYLFLMTEMDPVIHELVETGRIAEVDMTKWYPTYWFFNGRNFPDTAAAPGTALLPHQPYNCLPLMYPGEKVLKRLIWAGRDDHPHHPHGNNVTVIARDGRMFSSGPAAGPDLAYSRFTLSAGPGSTMDGIFTWTGYKLGWDAYGHKPSDPLAPREYAPDHGKPFPVTLPEAQDVTFGAAYAGSPFLGSFGVLPPGQGGLNPWGAFFYPWHSHHEKEIVNNDVFIGGMISLLVILPPDVPFP